MGMKTLENSVDILEVEKDAFEELINAVNTMTITDENTFEVTFEFTNFDNILKYRVNSKFHFLKHTKIFKSKNLSVEIVIIILNKLGLSCAKLRSSCVSQSS